MSYNDIKIVMWVIAIYKNKKWLWKVVNKKANQICVCCLEKPYGVNEPQNLETQKVAVFFDQVFHLMPHQFCPVLMQMVKKDVNGFDTTNCR